MRPLRIVLQIVFYLLVLLLLSSHSATAVVSHDENQFVAPAQLLADHGLLPYIDYPYTHMPYGIAFYAVAVKLTAYDYLASRLLNSLVWFLCTLLIVALTRVVRSRPPFAFVDPPPVPELAFEFALVLVLLWHPVASYVLGAALNHSFATFFSLLALLFFLRSSGSAAFTVLDPLLSGIFVSLAAFTRFNYASLVVVLFILWLLHARLFRLSGVIRTLVKYVLGVFIAAVPALVLLIVAPAHFYYGNLVYIRLNTVYYQGLLYRTGMDLVPKLAGFGLGLLQRPIDLILYAPLLALSILSFVRLLRRRSLPDLGLFATSGFAFVLWLTAFTPTPALFQYFFAPLPFLLLLAAWLALELSRFGWKLYLSASAVLVLAMLTSFQPPNPLADLARLAGPSSWTPVQVHDFALSLHRYVPAGRILTLLPMVPLEAGYDVYPFTATGPFSWRTSPLLTAQRRLQYGVTSPVELPSVLAAAPPAAVLTGFETPNPGFVFQDIGGLETPLNDYAAQHGFTRIELSPSFLGHSLILWVRP